MHRGRVSNPRPCHAHRGDDAAGGVAGDAGAPRVSDDEQPPQWDPMHRENAPQDAGMHYPRAYDPRQAPYMPAPHMQFPGERMH